jgi:GNAT superfamily N-acetyltransferase
MSDRPELLFRDLVSADYPVARRMIAAAYAGEPFATGMFGEAPLDRFSGMANQYASWPSGQNPVIIGADAGGTLVAVALATLPGNCPVCQEPATVLEPGSSDAERVEHEFQALARQSHLENKLPPHAHISTVATEPFLTGIGLGSQIVGELLHRLRSSGARCATLECLATRASFYERCGFRPVAEFDEPGAAAMRTMMMQIDLSR